METDLDAFEYLPTVEETSMLTTLRIALLLLVLVGCDDHGSSGSDTGVMRYSTCRPPISPTDTTGFDHKVGDGTANSCTRAALAVAVEKGGVITFDCGPNATILIDQTIDVPIDRDTVIDGGGLITLDGGGTTRIFDLNGPDYRKNTHKLVLQHLTLRRGKAAGTRFTPPDPRNPDCAYGYGKNASGGAVRVRDAVLHVIDCLFEYNEAASPGPDVGGGAIYALASLDVTVIGSRFVNNRGSNGGAVGLLQSNGTFVNTTFEENRATGVGQNYVLPGCPGLGHAGQGGAGGNGGAIYIDGEDDLEQYFCGMTFRANHGNELGGCVFRTANHKRRKTTFLQVLLDGNRAKSGGGCLYISNSELRLSQSLVANNIAEQGSGGGVRTELGTDATIVNTTFYNNVSLKGLMGALSHNGSGSIRNCTFAENKAEGGAGYFAAALGPNGTVRVYNSIFWNNGTKEPWNSQACWKEPKAGGNNLQWPKKRFGERHDDTPCVEDIRWENAKLGALTNNGGPTNTMMPVPGSPAIRAGSSCPRQDQRGRPRNPATCAAGAVEP